MVGDLGFEPRISWTQAKRVNPFPWSPKIKRPQFLFRGLGPEVSNKLKYSGSGPHDDARVCIDARLRGFWSAEMFRLKH